MTNLRGKSYERDHSWASAITWNDWWSRMSETGVCGDLTVATAEFGRLLFESTVERFAELVGEFRTIPVRNRRDLH